MQIEFVDLISYNDLFTNTQNLI